MIEINSYTNTCTNKQTIDQNDAFAIDDVCTKALIPIRLGKMWNHCKIMPIYCVLQLCSDGDGGGKKGIFTSNELQQNKRKIILLPYNFGSWFVGFVSLRVELYGSRLPYNNMRLVDYVPDLFIHYLTFAVCTHNATHTHLKICAPRFAVCQ